MPQVVPVVLVEPVERVESLDEMSSGRLFDEHAEVEVHERSFVHLQADVRAPTTERLDMQSGLEMQRRSSSWYQDAPLHVQLAEPSPSEGARLSDGFAERLRVAFAVADQHGQQASLVTHIEQSNAEHAVT